VDGIQTAIKAIELVEKELGIFSDSSNRLKLLINIETPKSLSNGICISFCARQGVMGLFNWV
jgi:hypothetical protein